MCDDLAIVLCIYVNGKVKILMPNINFMCLNTILNVLLNLTTFRQLSVAFARKSEIKTKIGKAEGVMCDVIKRRLKEKDERRCGKGKT